MSETEQIDTKRIPVSSSWLKLQGDGTRGVLLGKVCKSCGEHFFGAPLFCLNCTSADMEQVELSKEGTLFTFTIIHQAPPGWQGSVPYILGSVKLEEGPRISAEIVDCPEETIKMGMSMELILRSGGKDQEGNDIMVFKWKPST